MKSLNRRKFLKLAAASGAILTSGVGLETEVLAGTIRFKKGGVDYSPTSGNKREMIPSACWSCVTRDAMVGFVEDGRLVKLEGHPDSIRCQGKMCSKGQAGINQVYFPDRILYPMKRMGKRGEGKWKRVSWNDALTELAGRMKKLKDQGKADKFMFHYGRMKGSSSKLIKSVFLKNFGTKTIAGHTSICEGGKWVSHELTWGKHYDNWDFDNTNYILNFGCNLQEAHTNHIPLVQRMNKAMVDRNVKMVTFDVRLSNTAAKSKEFHPVVPGTDGAILLAMCHVVMQKGLYDSKAFKFLKVSAGAGESTQDKVSKLKRHLEPYTPHWAAKISGVSASAIMEIAVEFAQAKPAVLMTYRGAVAHENGNDTERAAQMLAGITGNINRPGGRCQAVGPKWKYPKGPKKAPKGKGLKITKGDGTAKIPSHGVCQQVLPMIKDGSQGRPDIYMTYCYNPVYVNGDFENNRAVMMDEKLMPYHVSSNIVYDESSKLADLILPDATYLERWDWEDMVSPNQVAEYYIRQPLVKPLGESRDLGDVVCDLAKRMGFPLGVDSKEEFVKISCEKTPAIKAVGGFDYMKKYGVWHDKKAKPLYYQHTKKVKSGDLEKDGVIFDKHTGVYWNWKKSSAKNEAEAIKKGYTFSKNSAKGYVGQMIDGEVYIGFKPDKISKSGYLELYSEIMEDKGFAPLPTYFQVPSHVTKSAKDLILTTFKVAVHIHSRSSHCKWLSEVYHDNPGWINSKTAAKLNIANGDAIRIKSGVNEIVTKAKVTENIAPGVVAISFHMGREESGRYGSGKLTPGNRVSDPDFKNKSWKGNGVHLNSLVPNGVDPVNGQMIWMDTVVSVSRA